VAGHRFERTTVNRRNLKSIFVGVTAVAALAAVALTTGILRPVSDPRALFEEAEQTARSCVQKRGHDYPSTGVPLGGRWDLQRRELRVLRHPGPARVVRRQAG
jgi:hypothetical protein